MEDFHLQGDCICTLWGPLEVFPIIGDRVDLNSAVWIDSNILGLDLIVLNFNDLLTIEFLEI